MKCSEKLNCYQRQSSLFEGSRSQASIDDDTTMMKGGIFSKSSYINLNFGIKQSKIGLKFAEQWPQKAKISELVDDRLPDFPEKCINLRQPYCVNKVHWSVKNS